jgi:uncharacterized protein (DUF779 family)
LTRYLNQVHDDFVRTGQIDHVVRRVVVDSWQRSVGSGLDPEYSRPQIRLDTAQLAEIRATHPPAAAMPIIQHGPLMFHQSGGCCDGSSPMCFADGDFITGDADELLGHLDAGTPEPIPVWMCKEQFAYWQHTHLTIDLVPGRGADSRWRARPVFGS